MSQVRDDEEASSRALRGLRVIELASRNTMYAGQLLADLGADVIVVEPVGGAATRRMPPFVNGVPGADRSVVWRALNTQKRTMTMDLESTDGQALFLDILAQSDVLLFGSGSPAAATALELPERLIVCEVSDFAAATPKSHYAGNDLVVMAASGVPAGTGARDREPVFYPVPQSIMESGAEAAVAVLSALAARDRDGLGQRATVSARIAAMASSFRQPVTVANGMQPSPRKPDGTFSPVFGGVAVPSIFACNDGYVECHVNPTVASFSKKVTAVAQCLFDEGFGTRAFVDLDWYEYSRRVAAGGESVDTFVEFVEAMNAYCAQTSKFAVVERGHRYGFMTAPILKVDEVLRFEQFRERDAWLEVDDPMSDGPVRVPSLLATWEGAPTAHRAPHGISEDTVEILQDLLKLEPEEIGALFVHFVI